MARYGTRLREIFNQHLLPEGSVAWQEGAVWFEEMVGDSRENLMRVSDQLLVFFGQSRFGEFEDWSL